MASSLASGNSGDIANMSGFFGPRITDLEKYYLGLPTRADYNTLQQSNNTQFNTINANIASMSETLDDLTAYIVNLKLAHTALYTSFTGHSTHPPGA
jgi:hypothetical protein